MSDTIDQQPAEPIPMVTLELAFAAPLFQRWQAAAVKVQPDPAKAGILTLTRIHRGLEKELLQLEYEAMARESQLLRKNSVSSVKVKA